MEKFGIIIDMSNLDPKLFNKELYEWFIRKILRQQFPYISLPSKVFEYESEFNQLYLENIEQFSIIESRIFSLISALGVHIPETGKIICRDDYAIIILGEKVW